MGLKDQVRGIIPDRALCHLSDHFDVIGDIAVLSLSPYLCGYEGTIAQAIISRRRHYQNGPEQNFPARWLQPYSLL